MHALNTHHSPLTPKLPHTNPPSTSPNFQINIPHRHVRASARPHPRIRTRTSALPEHPNTRTPEHPNTISNLRTSAPPHLRTAFHVDTSTRRHVGTSAPPHVRTSAHRPIGILRLFHYLCKPFQDCRGCGEIGRHTRLRIWRREAWGFESLHPHFPRERIEHFLCSLKIPQVTYNSLNNSI